MSSLQEKTSQGFSKERSLWYRVPKSRVILKKHSRGIGNNSLIRLAAENSAKQNLFASGKLNINESEALVPQHPTDQIGDDLIMPITKYRLSHFIIIYFCKILLIVRNVTKLHFLQSYIILFTQHL